MDKPCTLYVDGRMDGQRGQNDISSTYSRKKLQNPIYLIVITVRKIRRYRNFYFISETVEVVVSVI